MTLIFERITEVLCGAISALFYGFIWLFGPARLLEDIERDPTSPTEPMPSTPEGRQAMLGRMDNRSAHNFITKLPHVWVTWNADERERLLRACVWDETLYNLNPNQFFGTRPHFHFVHGNPFLHGEFWWNPNSLVMSGCCDPRHRCGPCHRANQESEVLKLEIVGGGLERRLAILEMYRADFDKYAEQRTSMVAGEMIHELATLHARSPSETAVVHMHALTDRVHSKHALTALAKAPVPFEIAERLIATLTPEDAARLLKSASRYTSDLRPRLVDRLNQARGASAFASDCTPYR